MKYILLYTNIKAYTYEADYHCIDCTKKRFPYMNYNLDPHPRECDINGLHEHQADNEGNRVHPVFDTGDTENPIQHMVCGDCHEIIDTYEVMEGSNENDYS